MSTMQLEILLFAGLRQRLQAERCTIEIVPPVTVRDAVVAAERQHPALASLLPTIRIAVDQVFVADDHVLSGHEEVAFIPPVSGGHDELSISLSSAPIDIERVARAVEHVEAGAVTRFTGHVRRNSHGETIDHLVYEAYAPMAVAAMDKIRRTIEQEIPGTRVAIHHRIGRLAVGEVAVAIAVSAPHRDEAFRGCREAIESLKRDVPIWKEEVSTAGERWFGRGP